MIYGQHISPVSSWIIYAIQLGYFVFAIQQFFKTDWKNDPFVDRVVAGSQIFVFTFCSMSGYTTSLFPPDYWDLREGIHIVLIISLYTMLLSNQILVNRRMLDSR